MISRVEDILGTYMSFNREDNMQKKAFGEGACNSLRILISH